MFSQEPNGKWADGPNDSVCGAEGRAAGVPNRGRRPGVGGRGRVRQTWLPGGEACGNWQGSLGRFPEREGGRKEEIGSR